jgi:single-stranded-DNA-specific exonuclease
VSATSIGYGLGPRINAAGRLESAMIAYNLLFASDVAQAQTFAQQVQTLNTERQDITREAQAMIRARIEEAQTKNTPLIFASDPSFRPGIVGLVAGRLTEEYFRPAVVMEEGKLESRASCRSIPQFDITQALDKCADLLVRHGGHAQAAGFTVLNQNIPRLKERLTELAYTALDGQELLPTLDIDAELDTSSLSEDLVAEIGQLEPTGHQNVSPVFATRNVYALERRVVGKEGQHLKLKIARAGRPPLDAIGFGLGSWASNLPERIDIAYAIEINEWNGSRSLQLNLQDIQPARGN